MPRTGCSVTKAERALIALAAGDALGWPQEFPAWMRGPDRRVPPSPELRAWVRRSGFRFAAFLEEIAAGSYTDDTQLTLAVARSRVLWGPKWWTAFTRAELPLWYLYRRGGGRGTKRAARCWIRGVPAWLHATRKSVREYFEHGGNGVAMRVLPHAIFLAGARNPRGLIRDVISDRMATHGHPRALIGATVYALAAWNLLRTKCAVRPGEVIEYLTGPVSSLGCPAVRFG